MSRARIMGSVVAVLVLGAGGYSAWRFASVSTASGSGTTSTIVTLGGRLAQVVDDAADGNGREGRGPRDGV
jgi:hypothetical protein